MGRRFGLLAKDLRMNRHAAVLIAGALLLALGGCTVGPKYVKPLAPVPDAYQDQRGSTASSDWSRTQPKDALPRGKWWQMFSDPQLSTLEEQLTVNNQDLKVAEGRLRQARAAIRFTRASKYPTITVGPSIGTERLSADQPYINPALINGGTGLFIFPIDLSYEVDLWGRVRRSIEASKQEAQAVAADLETAKLSLHAELARDYFEVRSADLQLTLLHATVDAYERALHLTELRYHGGASPRADVEQARTQLEDARVQETDIRQTRSDYEHALAVLAGMLPEQFRLDMSSSYELRPAAVPTGIPAALLERRPDIAAAERRVAEANNQIGIAKTAYFPSVTLQASAGFEGSSATNWFNWPSRFWAAGPNISETVFDGGRRRARSESALAGYDSSVALYRQTTLTSFQEVEDNLTAQAVLKTEGEQQRRATLAAEKALDLFMRRYKDGADTYLQVVVSQTVALQNERNEIDIRRRQMAATVLLVKALGGGWDTSQLPSY
jgi:NodT family efflux transporter outer membrane factor (OMF) lipoprotein